VACASAILRGRMQEVTGTCLVYEVTKVLYGRVGDNVVSVDCQGLPSVAFARRNLVDRLRREPKEAELQEEIAKAVYFERGGDAIVFLEECRKTEQGLMGRMLAPAYNGSPRFTLDDFEGEIIEVIRTGANLKVQEGNLSEYLRGAERVLRAELTRLTDTSAEWKVVSNLYIASQDDGRTHGGTPESPGLPGRIAIGLDPWRLRAEALVRYRTPGEPNRRLDEKEIQDLFVRLVETELKVGEQAILFVKSRHSASDAGKYKLIGLLASDPSKPQQLEKCDGRIRKLIEEVEILIPRH